MISRKKKHNLIIICSFFLIIALPTLDKIIEFSDNLNIELNENRNIAEFPGVRKSNGKISGSLLKKFPKNFDNYYNDNFGFRKPIVFLAKKSGLQKSSMNKRYVSGLDNWLFLTAEHSLKNALGSNLLNENELENVYYSLKKNRDLCKSNNIDYLFVIAPSKYSIYPEFLPKFISDIYKRKGIAKTNTDQILEFIKKKEPDFPILDLRKPLIKAKERGGENNLIYHKADTHWNGMGIEVGYKELKKELKNRFRIKLNSVKYNILKKEVIGGDLSEMSGINFRYPTSQITVRDYSILSKKWKVKKYQIESYKSRKSKNNKSVFVQHDSFFDNDMKSLLKNSFRTSNFTRKYGNCTISGEEIQSSSLVIHEMVERTFINCKKNSTK